MNTSWSFIKDYLKLGNKLTTKQDYWLRIRLVEQLLKAEEAELLKSQTDANKEI